MQGLCSAKDLGHTRLRAYNSFMQKFSFIFALTVSFVSPIFSSPASAGDWARLPSTDFEVPPPPAPGSAIEAEEFRILLDYQRSDRERECKLGNAQLHGTFDLIFAKSGLFTKDEVRRARELVSDVMEQTERITTYHKSQYQRERPYDTNPAIHPCVRKPGGKRSYPSSHASTASAGACVLAEIFPNRKAEILEYGKYVGHLRAVVGVHHPSDVLAGQTLGAEYCVRIMEDSNFRRELRKVKGD